MYNNQNNALAEQKTFMLPAAIPEGEFTKEELAEDMDGLQMSFPRSRFRQAAHCSLRFPLTIRKARIMKKLW